MKSYDSKASVSLGRAILFSGAALSIIACGRDRNAPLDDHLPRWQFSSEDAGAECQDSIRCSSDLKRVVRLRCDGTEEVITECGPDFGCGDNACVDACTSASLAKGSIGCSFAMLPPDDSYYGPGSCFAATIANVWDRAVTVHASLGHDSIDVGPSTYYVEVNERGVDYVHVEGAIEPGKVALVFLAQSASAVVPCPSTVVPALREDPIRHNTARTRAFRLTTDTPVSAYSIWPYGGGRSDITAAALLLPVSSWDTNYIAVSTYVPRPNIGRPFLQIVASDDDTEVTMRPNASIRSGVGLAGVGREQTQTWTLGRGEVLQITQEDDLSGSPIETSKPVGIFGGSECMFMLAEFCDLTHQQIPAVSRWGSTYALVPYRPRNDFGIGMTTVRERVPWRLIGAANGTTLTYDPAPPSGAVEMLEAGQVVDFVTSELVTVRSQDKEHPFYVGMFMTGSEFDDFGTFDGRGDPEFVNVVPSEQFLDRYVFSVDHTYLDTTLTFVRQKTPAGFLPVVLDCSGEVTDWKPLGSGGEYEFAWVSVTKDGAPQEFAEGTCDYGRHEAHGDGPFAIYVWGTDTACSYGYAGGQGSRVLSKVKGPPVN